MRTAALRTALAALALVLALPAAAQNFLWKVDSLTNHIYLFGTVHAGRGDWFPLPPVVENALAECPVLAVEADVTDRKAMAASSGTGMYTPPDSLEKHVDARDYARFAALARAHDIPLADVDAMKPFLAGSLLIFSEWGRLGYYPQFAVDTYLLEEAHKRGQRVVELDGVAAQSRLIDSLTEAEGREFLAGTVRAFESGLVIPQIEGVVHAWESGDTDEMLDVARRYDAAVPGAAAIDEKFVWSRNPAFLAKIAAILDQGSQAHFVAVGALHLVGPRGLVEALRARGYQVRRIFVAPRGEKKP